MRSYLLLLLSLILTPAFSQQIEFFNVGCQDQPLENIIVSIEPKTEGDYLKNILVSRYEYNLIKMYVIKHNTYQRPIINSYFKYRYEGVCSGIYDFGCYAVQLEETNKSLFYFMDENEKSVKYFKGLISILEQKGKRDIAKAFQNLLIRIEIIEVELEE